MVVLNMVAFFVWKIFIADFPVYLRLKKNRPSPNLTRAK